MYIKNYINADTYETLQYLILISYFDRTKILISINISKNVIKLNFL